MLGLLSLFRLLLKSQNRSAGFHDHCTSWNCKLLFPWCYFSCFYYLFSRFLLHILLSFIFFVSFLPHFSIFSFFLSFFSVFLFQFCFFPIVAFPVFVAFSLLTCVGFSVSSIPTVEATPASPIGAADVRVYVVRFWPLFAPTVLTVRRVHPRSLFLPGIRHERATVSDHVDLSFTSASSVCQREAGGERERGKERA